MIRILRGAANLLAGKVEAGRDLAARALGQTVREAFPAFLEEHVRGKKPETVRGIRSTSLHVIHVVGEVPLSRISRTHGHSLLEEIAKGNNHTRRPSQARANQALTLLCALYEHAMAQGHAKPPNPLIGIRRFGRPRRERALSPDEFAAVWWWTLEIEARKRMSKSASAAIRLLALTGMRHQEAVALEWSSVRLDHQLLMLPDSKTGPKSVPIGKDAVALLAQLPRTSRWVFPSPFTNEKRICDVEHPLRKVYEAAGITGCCVHTLRHTWATISAELNVPESHAQAVLGHSSPLMTRKYIHLSAQVAVPSADTVTGYLAKLGESYGEGEGASRHVLPEQRWARVDPVCANRHKPRSGAQHRAQGQDAASKGARIDRAKASNG